MFLEATKSKLRFKTPQGLITTEDLWDLSLTALDNIAKGLRKELRESEESFIGSSRKDSKAEIAFEVVKEVIKVRLEEKEAAKTAAEKKARKEAILEILEKKKGAALEQMTEEQLKKELESL